jgi:hypothetical protein
VKGTILKKELNVLFLSRHCCIRVVKEGLALLNAGVNVYFLQARVQNPEFMRVLPQMSFWDSEAELRDKLAGLTGFDVIHIHNEPSWIGTVAKQVRPDLPVIMDCHDLNSERTGEHNDEEDEMVAAVDGFITPSQGYAQHINEFYSSYKPVETIYSLCNEDFYWDRFPAGDAVPRVPGIVYEGGITADDNHPHPYRDYREVTRQLTGMGIAFHLYGANDRWNAIYQDLGAYTYPLLPYNAMLRSLSRYDWGFVGPGMTHRAFDHCMPNKLFESMAAGIPVIVWKAQEAAEWVKKYNVGVVVNRIEDIAKLTPDMAAEHRKIVRSQKFTMENQVGKLLKFYEQFVGA